ncbi:MAG TPA: HWE histidine kinase domain-containing protein [Pseudolabrys sp.]|nr:HWE histidine kinase domain-containing protein [Pseudolabrys sp.]
MLFLYFMLMKSAKQTSIPWRLFQGRQVRKCCGPALFAAPRFWPTCNPFSPPTLSFPAARATRRTGGATVEVRVASFIDRARACRVDCLSRFRAHRPRHQRRTAMGQPKRMITAMAQHHLPGAADNELTTLQRELRRLEAQLDAQGQELRLLHARFKRYETALSSSQVTVYTQDHELHYTSASNPVLGRAVDDVLGRTDEDIMPRESGATVISLKREALASGESKRTEFSYEDGSSLRWNDLHIEPLRNEAGDIVGLTCASVDVTERKEGEAHLRLLMRELTHRSKNLLAVIQAMARQTARHAGSIDGFLNQFSARLQALAASHDLLVRESWHGASLREIIQSQLAAYIGGGKEQVEIEGDPVVLRPEAAQNLGLALHELATNAAKFGALSVAGGRVSIDWLQHDNAMELNWREHRGPKVKVRRKKGFGSMVIERNLARALDAKVEMAFDPDGFHCHIVIPASQILSAL